MWSWCHSAHLVHARLFLRHLWAFSRLGRVFRWLVLSGQLNVFDATALCRGLILSGRLKQFNGLRLVRRRVLLSVELVFGFSEQLSFRNILPVWLDIASRLCRRSILQRFQSFHPERNLQLGLFLHIRIDLAHSKHLPNWRVLLSRFVLGVRQRAILSGWCHCAAVAVSQCAGLVRWHGSHLSVR